MSHSQHVLVFLTLLPTDDQLFEYMSYRGHGYRVYVIIDDNNFVPPPQYSHICIQINDNHCIRRGFVNFNPAIYKRPCCSAWDKAIYALSYLISGYQKSWIIEEDVFVPSPSVLARLDANYPYADLLVKSCDKINGRDRFNDAYWPWLRHVPFTAFLPKVAHGMVCACRVSENLIQDVALFIKHYSFLIACFNMYARSVNFIAAHLPGKVSLYLHQKYPFIEYIFHSLALCGGYKICTPNELATIYWRRDWSIDDIVPTNLYHPVKNVSSHALIRQSVLSDSLD